MLCKNIKNLTENIWIMKKMLRILQESCDRWKRNAFLDEKKNIVDNPDWFLITNGRIIHSV